MNQRVPLITGVPGQDGKCLAERLVAVERAAVVAETAYAGHG